MALNLPFGTKDLTREQSPNAKPIQNFVAQVKTSGIARTNRYAVNIAKVPGWSNTSTQNILLFCDQAQLPGVNYSTVQNRVFGEFREVPYEKLYDSLTLSFYVDTDMKVKEMFDDWMNAISNPNTRTYGYYNDYTTQIDIEVQDINDKKRYQLTLSECYPKNIGTIQLDYASKDIMKLTVQMQYKNWTATPVTQLPNDQVISTSLIDKFTRNFTGFQETLNKTLGGAGNFVTGAVMSYGVTRLPSLLKF